MEQLPLVYTQRHWAKSDRADPRRIHLLEHHLADVGACFEALLKQPTIRKRLARTADLDHLNDGIAARLAVFAALHDIGKVNVGFQTQIWQPQDFRGARKPRWASHTSDLVPVLTGVDSQTCDWFADALGFEEFLSWDDDDGQTASAIFAAAISHHGEPLNLHDSKQPNSRVWRPFRDLSPEDCVRRIGRLARKWFPAAFSDDVPPLPSAPEFQHMFLGLCTLADWIGSSEEFFQFVDEDRDDYIDTARQNADTAMKGIGLDIGEQRAAFSQLPDFGALFGIDGSPNAIQKAMLDIPLDRRVLIVESETGSGKTEAALWRFAHMYQRGIVDGIYFALPTRAAAVQIHGRVNRFIERMFPGARSPEPVLAVPGYVRAGDISGGHLPDYQVWWEDEPGHSGRARRWAAESVKRFLAAQIAVGTIDQAMMSALQVRHAHMRAACLARNLLVVDEVHASDPYMRVIIEALLDAHVGAGGYALLMSATLGSSARRQWLSRRRRSSASGDFALDDAIATPYPAVTHPGPDVEIVHETAASDRAKRVGIAAKPLMREFGAVAEIALEAARSGAKALIVRNTVGYAIDTQRAIEEAAQPGDSALPFSCGDVPTLHHGRFAASDRRLLDEAVERDLGRPRSPGGSIVVGTQTLEQSLDIDADLLITDLCPMDVLLQRIGRLHRHAENERPPAYRDPTCIVLTPPDDDLSPLLSKERGAPSPNGLGLRGGVYPDLRVLELTRRLISERSEWRIPEMNRDLVERATHPAELESLVEEMGDNWKELRNEVEGRTYGDVQTARLNLLKRRISFLDREVVFSGAEERIRTRLGDEGIEVEFSSAQPSPFGGAEIESLSLPVRWLGDSTIDVAVAPTNTNGGFVFAVGENRFAYDRLGLRRD